MRIKKVSATTTTTAEIIDGYSSSTKDGYSCNYINEIVHGTVLYANDNGSNSNISLNDTLANYTYVEVFWKTQYNNRIYSNKLYKPNGKNSQFFYVEGANYNADKYNNTYLFWSDLYFSGTSIQIADAHGLTSLSGNYTEGTNRVFITRVIGYK